MLAKYQDATPAGAGCDHAVAGTVMQSMPQMPLPPYSHTNALTYKPVMPLSDATVEHQPRATATGVAVSILRPQPNLTDIMAAGAVPLDPSSTRLLNPSDATPGPSDPVAPAALHATASCTVSHSQLASAPDVWQGSPTCDSCEVKLCMELQQSRELPVPTTQQHDGTDTGCTALPTTLSLLHHLPYGLALLLHVSGDPGSIDRSGALSQAAFAAQYPQVALEQQGQSQGMPHASAAGEATAEHEGSSGQVGAHSHVDKNVQWLNSTPQLSACRLAQHSQPCPEPVLFATAGQGLEACAPALRAFVVLGPDSSSSNREM